MEYKIPVTQRHLSFIPIGCLRDFTNTPHSYSVTSSLSHSIEFANYYLLFGYNFLMNGPI